VSEPKAKRKKNVAGKILLSKARVESIKRAEGFLKGRGLGRTGMDVKRVQN